jgi:hypothetical protein
LFRSLPAVLAWHRGHYPLLRAQDVYKLIHQGVFGPGHIITSAAAAHKALACELAALQVPSPKDKGRSQKELAVEPIDPDGRLVRVNLRPLFGQVGSTDTEWLVEALIESAKRAECDPDRMKRRLAAAVRWCRNNLPRQAAGLERMAARAEESGFPAFHHSPAYARAYRPAYRVILRSCLSPDLGVNHQDTKSQRAG